MQSRKRTYEKSQDEKARLGSEVRMQERKGKGSRERERERPEFEDHSLGFPGSSDSKEFACNAGDLFSIPGLGRSPGEGNGRFPGNSCLENPMNRGAWWSPWGQKELDSTE